MKQVVIDSYTVPLLNIPSYTPIFAKLHDKLAGMLVNEGSFNIPKWILRLGGTTAIPNHYTTREACIQHSMNLGYFFYIED